MDKMCNFDASDHEDKTIIGKGLDVRLISFFVIRPTIQTS